MTPALPGPERLRATAATIAAAQAPCGAIPWEVEGDTAGKVDAWDHVESAMALLTAGEVAAAEAAYAWLAAEQREDGTWPIEWRVDAPSSGAAGTAGTAEVGGGPGETATAPTTAPAAVVVDAGVDANMCTYVAVGVWHHWLVRRDLGFVTRLWPVVAAAIDAVVAMQLPGGGIAWARGAGGTTPTALLTGSSSVHHALSCATRLADLLGHRRPTWEAARLRLGDALRARVARELDGCVREDDFEDTSRYSMDWYYPVLGGALTGDAAARRLESRWADFVVPGLGIRCVDDHPWVTGAETCELALALWATGQRDRARRLLADMQHLRDESGSYHTGLVYADGKRWPVERSTWTGAAVILAADALAGGPGAQVFRPIGAGAARHASLR